MEIISGVGCSIIKHLCEMCNFLGVSSFFTIFVMRLGTTIAAHGLWNVWALIKFFTNLLITLQSW